jgi:hypothetical protein
MIIIDAKKDCPNQNHCKKGPRNAFFWQHCGFFAVFSAKALKIDGFLQENVQKLNFHIVICGGGSKGRIETLDREALNAIPCGEITGPSGISIV